MLQLVTRQCFFGIREATTRKKGGGEGGEGGGEGKGVAAENTPTVHCSS